jgi:hypothetical protein
MEENNHNKEMHKWHGDFIPWFGQCLLHVVVTSFGQGLHSTPLKWSKDQTWVPRFSSLSQVFPLWGISTSWSLSPLHNWSQVNHKSKAERESTTRDKLVATHAHKSREKSAKIAQRCYSSKQVPKSLSTKAKAWIRCLGVVGCSMTTWCRAPYA